MASYYYLAASMPMLGGLDMVPPLTSAGFLDACRCFMPDDHYFGIVAAVLVPEGPGAFMLPLYRQYYQWECSLRDQLVKLRAARQSLQEDVYLRNADDVFGTAATASEAVSKATPLEAEACLNTARWNFVEELAVGHFFNLEYLTAYRLQLQLVERQAMFEEEKGFAAYCSIYARVLEASEAQVPAGSDNV